MAALCLRERPLCPADGKGKARLGKRRSPRRNLDWEVVAAHRAVQGMLKPM